MKTRIMAAVVGLLAAMLVALPNGGSSVANASVYSKLNKIQKRILSGFASMELTRGVTSPRGQRFTAQAPGSLSANFQPGPHGCSGNIKSNVKVNQNCLNVTDSDLQGRGQAQNETAIAQDPLHPGHIVAGWNDYRRGDGNCIGG